VAATVTPVSSAAEQQQDNDDDQDHFHGKPRSGDERRRSFTGPATSALVFAPLQI
jgi:hypothetical protein